MRPSRPQLGAWRAPTERRHAKQNHP
jgi:hypothetical protein